MGSYLDEAEKQRPQVAAHDQGEVQRQHNRPHQQHCSHNVAFRSEFLHVASRPVEESDACEQAEHGYSEEKVKDLGRQHQSGQVEHCQQNEEPTDRKAYESFGVVSLRDGFGVGESEGGGP